MDAWAKVHPEEVEEIKESTLYFKDTYALKVLGYRDLE